MKRFIIYANPSKLGSQNGKLRLIFNIPKDIAEELDQTKHYKLFIEELDTGKLEDKPTVGTVGGK